MLDLIWSLGSLCSYTSVWLSGPGNWPKSLLAVSSFQVPERSGFLSSCGPAAIAARQNAVTASATRHFFDACRTTLFMRRRSSDGPASITSTFHPPLAELDWAAERTPLQGLGQVPIE